MNTAEVAGPGPSLVGRKVSAAFSETDSGVDVETEGEESLEAREEKRVIRPSEEVISRLCNFDEDEEEEEEELTDTDTDSDEADSEAEDTVHLSLLELKHIMSALVHEYVEVCGNISFIMLQSVICQILSVESGKISPNAHYDLVRVWSEQWLLQAGPGGAAILAGSRCAVCRQTIFSLWLGTGARCGVCSFLVCRHCASQVTASADTCYNPCVPRNLVTGAPVSSVMHRICGLRLLYCSPTLVQRRHAALQHCRGQGWMVQCASVLGPAARAIANINCSALHSACSLQCARCSLLCTSNIFRNSNQVHHPVAVRGTLNEV